MSALTIKNSSLVSVVIPVFNAEKYLAQAVESVLAQTYKDVELIVVDDGSTDGSGRVAQGFSSVRYCQQSNSGIGAGRNQGVKMSHGEFLAFLDADDLWSEDKLSVQIAALETDCELDMVFGHVQEFLSPELEAHGIGNLRYPDKAVPGYIGGTMLIKRDAFLRVGMFETSWHLGEFIDWYAKAMEKKLKSLLLPDVVLRRRLHTSNQGINRREFRTDYARILKAALDRRRKLESNSNLESS